MSLYELRGVEFRYGAVQAVRGIHLRVEAGERIAILGANGSGKSTLLRMLAGLSYATAGEVRFDDSPVNERAFESLDFALNFRRRVQMVFQNADAQLFCATVEEELAFGPLQLRLPEDAVRSRIEMALKATGIEILRTRSPHRLSGGEKKRVALAAVMALEPEVLLLDEPTASLDPRTQGQIVDFLRALPADRTILTTTHDLHLLPEIATRCLVISEGQLVADAGVEEVLANEELLESTNLIYRRRR